MESNDKDLDLKPLAKSIAESLAPCGRTFLLIVVEDVPEGQEMHSQFVSPLAPGRSFKVMSDFLKYARENPIFNPNVK